ncbi:MAG: hypothetical protein SFU91_14640 [Chloroherpetonaceae bacterium]|nr:hypothetical protein [Chloroherpetonaceae bacterium]
MFKNLRPSQLVIVLFNVLLLICFASCSSSKPLESPKESLPVASTTVTPILPIAPVWQSETDQQFNVIQMTLAKSAPDSIRQKAVRADTADIFIGDFVSLTYLTQSVLRNAVPTLDSVSTFLLKTLPIEPDSLAKSRAARMLEGAGMATSYRLDSLTRASYSLFDSLAMALQNRYRASENWTAADAAFAASHLVKCRELIRLQALLAERSYYEYSKVFERNRELQVAAPPAEFQRAARDLLLLTTQRQKMKALTLTAVAADLESKNALIMDTQLDQGKVREKGRKKSAKPVNPYWLREGAAEFGKLSEQLRQTVERLEPLSLRLQLLVQP